MAHIVAALDDNHNGDLDTARRLIDAAVACGCHGVKLTARTPGLSATDAILNRRNFLYPSLGDSNRSVRERLNLAETQHAALLAFASGRLDYIVAPYDIPALEMLRTLQVTAIQIDPPCATNEPLLQAAGRRRLPVLLDTGSCTPTEVVAAVAAIGDVPLTLIHGLSDGVDATLPHVKALESLRNFGLPIGYRDTGPGFTPALVAIMLGANLVEKRLTLDRAGEGPHHANSLLPLEMKAFVDQARELATCPPEQLIYRVLASDHSLVDVRSSIVARCAILKGTLITADMLALKPPMRGLSPRLMPWVIGRAARYDIAADEHVTFGLLD